MWCAHLVEYYAAFKSRETLRFTTWVNLGEVFLRKVSQTQRDAHRLTHLHADSKTVILTSVRSRVVVARLGR